MSKGPRPILESDDEQKYVNWCKEELIVCEKVKFQQVGYPDRLSILPSGLHVWIEFKRRLKKVSANTIQDYRIRALRKQGALAGWTDDSNIAICCVQALLATARLPEESYPFTFIPVSWGFVFRSWLGEDINLLSCYQDLKVKGFDWQGTYHSAVETRLQGMA
jgi:hypothetical protein